MLPGCYLEVLRLSGFLAGSPSARYLNSLMHVLILPREISRLYGISYYYHKDLLTSSLSSCYICGNSIRSCINLHILRVTAQMKAPAGVAIFYRGRCQKPQWEVIGMSTDYSVKRPQATPDEIGVLAQYRNGEPIDWTTVFRKGWFSRLVACKRPGESIKAFCRRGGFSERTFRRWRKNPDEPGPRWHVMRNSRKLGVSLGWLLLGATNYAPQHTNNQPSPVVN